jgi:hypothetical protein
MMQPCCAAGLNSLPVRLTLALVLLETLTIRGQELRQAHLEPPVERPAGDVADTT